MKNSILLIVAIVLCMPIYATKYMCIELNNEKVKKYDVETVDEVYYKSVDDILKKTYMYVVLNDEGYDRYLVNQVVSVFYEDTEKEDANSGERSMETISYDSIGNETSRNVIVYNNNNPQSIIMYLNQSLYGKTEMTYDGNIVKSKGYSMTNGDLTLNSYQISEYESNEYTQIKCVYNYFSDSDSVAYLKTNYEYDAKGRKILQTEFTYGEKSKITEYSYDDNINSERCFSIKNGEETFLWHFVNEYEDNIIRNSYIYDEKGEELSRTTYTQSNDISSEINYLNGKISSKEETKYEGNKTIRNSYSVVDDEFNLVSSDITILENDTTTILTYSVDDGNLILDKKIIQYREGQKYTSKFYLVVDNKEKLQSTTVTIYTGNWGF